MVAPLGRLSRALLSRAASRVGRLMSAWGRGARTPEQAPHLTELDKADALMLRRSHETVFLSWFRNGLLSTGIGVISYVQSDVGREAGYAFFILGGASVAFGGASYVANHVALRRLMLLSVPAVLFNGVVVSGLGLLWLCAVSLYIGRLEVEIVHEEDEDGDCEDCGGRRERRHRGDKGQDK